MTASDLVSISSRQIIRMRRRYRGPLIGATLGVAALIAVVTLGDLMQKAIGSNLGILGGATIVKVNINLEEMDYTEDPRQFSDQDIAGLEAIPCVVSVTASVYSWWPSKLWFNASYRGIEHDNIRIMGTDPSFFKLSSYLPIVEGRGITDDDVREARNICILGDAIRYVFFDEDESPIGKSVLVGDIYCEVVGVLGKPDDNMLDETILIPLSTARRKLAGMGAIRRLSVLPEDIYVVESVREHVSNTLTAKKSKYPYEVYFDKERVAIIRMILNIFQIFVYAAVLATLILSGVGVANVMLATVRERTPEIGLRKAVGATDWDIASQFMLESVVVSLLSSVVGILVGTTIVVLVSFVALRSSFELTMYGLAVIAAVMTCAISGVVAGVVPARVASALDPIDALRSE